MLESGKGIIILDGKPIVFKDSMVVKVKTADELCQLTQSVIGTSTQGNDLTQVIEGEYRTTSWKKEVGATLMKVSGEIDGTKIDMEALTLTVFGVVHIKSC